MLSQAQRTTILELHTQGIGKREIARVMGISRPTVRKVLRSKATQVPELHRTEKAEPYGERILELFSTCKGNLVRVHEELGAFRAPSFRFFQIGEAFLTETSTQIIVPTSIT